MGPPAESPRTSSLSPRAARRRMLSREMESHPTYAEGLPALYRAILDAVAELEHAGERGEAGRVRADATRAYSRAWDEVTQRRLEQLHVRARRRLDAGQRPEFALRPR